MVDGEETKEENQNISKNEIVKLRNELEAMRLRESIETKENQEKFQEIQILLEKEQMKAQLYFEQLKETQDVLAKKQEENSKKQPYSPRKPDFNNITVMKEAKGAVDSIIETLSKPNDSKNLLKVSKDLLDLQEFLATNLTKSEEKINSLIAVKRNSSANSANKNHKHSPSSNIDYNVLKTEPQENIRTSNFNIYKTSAHY